MDIRRKESVTSKYHKKSRFIEVIQHMKKNKGAVAGTIFISTLIIVALTAHLWIDFDTQVTSTNISIRLQRPSVKHLMGTDALGRDVFFRLLYATRYSLPIGFVAVLVSLAVGGFLGAVAGYYGGFLENIIMRFTDIFSSVPNILMAICLVSALGKTMFNMMLAVGLSSAPLFARITRASVLTVRNQDYVEAAISLGIPRTKILFTHILPNCLSPIIVQATMRIASALVSASALSFLGMSIPAPAPEWGSMLSAGREVIRSHSYLTFFPGLIIMVTVLAFNLIGDALRDALDPKLKR